MISSVMKFVEDFGWSSFSLDMHFLYLALKMMVLLSYLVRGYVLYGVGVLLSRTTEDLSIILKLRHELEQSDVVSSLPHIFLRQEVEFKLNYIQV